MADQKLIIEIDGQQVTSELQYDARPQNNTRVWITSTCGGYSQRNPMVIAHNVGYSAAQAEHDIEEARWRHAQEVVARMAIRTTVPGVIVPVGTSGTSPVRTVSAKEHPAPNGH
jgi:hypothetical protein